jgi:arsenate reductase (thioredoxin)
VNRMTIDRELALRTAVSNLTREFAGIFGAETIERYILETSDYFKDSQVTTFVPLLVQRFTRERLNALAQAEGRITKTEPEVLFVCVHNAGRSQMAAALTDALSGGRVHVRSAGSEPADRLNPAVVTVMGEMGLDVSKEFPKPLTNEVVQAADVVVTMGCGDACPIYPGKRYFDWEVDDPEGQSVEKVRVIASDIRSRVGELLGDYGIEPAPLPQVGQKR